MRILTKAQVLMLHEQLVNETGGSLGLRDEGMLESALASPFQEFATFSPYPTIQQKAARLGFCLVMNHPFIDGNKRIGATAFYVRCICSEATGKIENPEPFFSLFI